MIWTQVHSPPAGVVCVCLWTVFVIHISIRISIHCSSRYSITNQDISECWRLSCGLSKSKILCVSEENNIYLTFNNPLIWLDKINKCIKRCMSLAINIRGLPNLSHTFCILVVIGVVNWYETMQPRYQGLSSLLPLVIGRKTPVAAGNVTTQNLGVKKICWVGGVAECFVCCYDKPCGFKTLISS